MQRLASSVLGIEVPDTRPLFLAFVAVHVAAGLVAVASGAVAMLSAKRPGRHPGAGRVYLASLVGVVATAAVLAGLRWPHDTALIVLGGLALLAAGVGWRARRQHHRGWRRPHIGGMGSSFAVVLTGFYVDNGPHLPVWDRLPTFALWMLPTVVAAPLIIRAARRYREPGSASSPVHSPRE